MTTLAAFPTSVVAGGYVGSTTGVCLARPGRDLILADTSDTTVDWAGKDQIPIVEAVLDSGNDLDFPAGKSKLLANSATESEHCQFRCLRVSADLSHSSCTAAHLVHADNARTTDVPEAPSMTNLGLSSRRSGDSANGKESGNVQTPAGTRLTLRRHILLELPYVRPASSQRNSDPL